MSTITHEQTSTTFTPFMVEFPWTAETTADHAVHTIIGRGNPDITLRPMTPRTGGLTLIFSDEASASTAAAVHRLQGTFVITGVPGGSMRYAATVVRDVQRDGAWSIEIDYLEVV